MALWTSRNVGMTMVSLCVASIDSCCECSAPLGLAEAKKPWGAEFFFKRRVRKAFNMVLVVWRLARRQENVI